MKKEQESNKQFTRRALLVGTAQLAFMGVLGARLGWLQIVEGQKYKTLADKNRINMKMLAPSRGQIFDRYHTPLATNTKNFRVLAIQEKTKNLKTSLYQLQNIISLNDRTIDNVLKAAKKTPSFIPLKIKDNLTWEEMAAIEVNLPDLPGLFIDIGETRIYPRENSTAHIIGYVGAVNEFEIKKDKMFSLPGFKIGKTGIEKSFDKELRGKEGNVKVEVNVQGREVRELTKNDSATGKHLTLTIDAELQNYVQSRLASEQSASATILDANTGAIYAMASTPSFDPNLFTQGISAEQWEELLSNPGLPLNNKAVSGQYPPASTFKMVTALAALEEGVINSYEKISCKGHYDFGGNRFHCWNRGGHGPVNVIDALAESCDIYFYKIAVEIGIDRIAKYARQLGLGQRFGMELSEESPGLIPDKAWKMGHKGETWKKGDTVVASIGQGDVQITPLQLAVMTARLVNGGYAIKPWMVGAVGKTPKNNHPAKKLSFKDSNLTLIYKGMNRVVTGKNGTARKSRIPEEKFQMGGKTGTAQVRRISLKDRREGTVNENIPWDYRDHALFVGYAPIKNPRYACSVVVEHGGGGSATAAPIARDILYQTQKRAPADHTIQTGISVSPVKE